MKPIILAKQVWGKRFAIEVKLDRQEEIERGMREARKAIRSSALSQLFLLIARGVESPTEIAGVTGKSKFAVSVQLSELRATGLIRQRQIIGDDLRRRLYEVAWERVGQFFMQDNALEVEIYENRLLAERFREVRGTTGKAELVVLGNGKLGLVRQVIPDNSQAQPQNSQEVANRMNRLVWEFVQLFKEYMNGRRFPTIREYFLGVYKELSEHYVRLPRGSELARFYEFTNRTFTKIDPIEQLWRKALRKPTITNMPNSFRPERTTLGSVKLFAEAGGADHAGRYLLNAEAQSVTKPGMRLRIYPSYTYGQP